MYVYIYFSSLLFKHSFRWEAEHQGAFEAIKRLLVSAGPVIFPQGGKGKLRMPGRKAAPAIGRKSKLRMPDRKAAPAIATDQVTSSQGEHSFHRSTRAFWMCGPGCPE